MAEKTLAGRPIRGEIKHYTDKPRTQKPIKELIDKLDALLAFPEVHSVKWRQYTPYFNDGDPCTFSAYGAAIRFEGDDPEAGDYEDGYHEIYGTFPDGYWDTHAWFPKPGDGKLPRNDEDRIWFPDLDLKDGAAIGKAAVVFSAAIESGEHYNALLEHFGDPAEVIANRDGFDVEYYEHE